MNTDARAEKARAFPEISGSVMLVLATLVSCSHAAPVDGQRASAPIIGAWRLVSLDSQYTDGTTDTSWMGSHPKGVIVYDSTGHMSVQISHDPPTSWPVSRFEDATAAQKAAAFGGFYGYFGTYEVDERGGIVLHHVERSLWPTEIGVTYKRFFKLEGDRLTLTTSPITDEGPREFRNVLVWERARR